MPVTVVDSDFVGFTTTSAVWSIDVPAGAQTGDTLFLTLARSDGALSGLDAWELQRSQLVSDFNNGAVRYLEIYAKPYEGETEIEVTFPTSAIINSLTLVVVRTSAGTFEVEWVDSFAEHSGGGGDIVDGQHRLPFRSEPAATQQLVFKATYCEYAQQAGSTFFDDTVSGDSDLNDWAQFEGNEQHTPVNTPDNRIFVATETVEAGAVMLDGSGIGSDPTHANVRHVTGIHDGASITLVIVDPNDTPPTIQQQFQITYADVAGRDPLPTALTQRTPAQQLVNYLVRIYAGNNPRIVRKPVMIQLGEFDKTSPAPPAGKLCREIWINDPRDPNFKNGRRAVILGRSGGAEPGTVELTLLIADNAASFVEPS